MATRRERVVLDLEDRFTAGVVRAAVATETLDKALNDLDGSGKRVTKSSRDAAKSTDELGQSTGRTRDKIKQYTIEQAVADEKTRRLRQSLRDQAKAMLDAESAAKSDATALRNVGNESRRASPEIDKFSGRLKTLADAAITLGPALIPLGAAAIPALTASLAGLGTAAGAIGVTVLAMHGLGDAIGAIDDYRLEPTTANLDKLREAQEKLGPAANDFARYIANLEPVLHNLQEVAGENMFPGLEDGIAAILGRGPQVQRIIANLASGMGDIAREAGQGLGGPKFTAFFDYIESDAKPTLEAFAHSTGNVALGVSNMLVAFAPLTRDFTGGLESATKAFADWSAGLSQNKSFQSFLDYIRQSGPQAVDFLKALVDAFAGLARAAAPFGSTVLPMLTAVAQVFAAVADSPIGPSLYAAAAGMIALSRGAKLLGPSMTGLNTAFLDLRTSPNVAATAMQRFGGAAKLAAGAAGMGLFVTSLHETNKGLSALEGAAGGALAGFSVGGPWGAAVGGAIGLIVDLGRSHEDTSKEVADLTATFDQQTGAITENTRAKAVSKLQDAGLLDAAEQIGISTSLVTDAVLGNADAQAKLNAALAGYDVDNTITSAKDMKRSFSDQEIATTLANRAATALKDGIPGLTNVFGAAAGNAQQFAGAMAGTTDSMNQGKTAAQQLSDALDHLNNKLERRSAARDYHQAILDFNKSLKENGKTLDQNTYKGIANQAALDRIASSAVALIGTLHGTAKVEALTQARRDFVDAATKLLGSRDAAQQLANKLGLLNKTRVNPTITADDRRAQGAIRDTGAGLGKLNRTTATAKINADGSGATSTINQVTTMLRNLNGTTATTYVRTVRNDIPLPGRSAEGGTVPKTGMGYADRWPYMLADGEEVISNRYGQADRHRALLKAINAQGMAGGGTAGGNQTYTSSLHHGGGGFGDAIQIWTDGVYTAAKALKALNVELAAQKKALDKAKSARDQALSNRNDLSSTIQQSLMGDSIFSDIPAAGSIWAAGSTAGGPATPQSAIAALNARKDRAQRFLAAVNTLKGKGVTGAALQAILGEGLEAAEAMAAADVGTLSSFSSALNESNQALAAAGLAGGNAVFGGDVKATQHALNQAVKELHEIKQAIHDMDKANQKGHKDNAKDVKDGVNGAASNGHRRGHR